MKSNFQTYEREQSKANQGMHDYRQNLVNDVINTTWKLCAGGQVIFWCGVLKIGMYWNEKMDFELFFGPYISYSRYCTGISLQQRLMWGVFSNANGINLIFKLIFTWPPSRTFVSVLQREHEFGLFTIFVIITFCPSFLSYDPTVLRRCHWHDPQRTITGTYIRNSFHFYSYGNLIFKMCNLSLTPQS